MWNTFLYGGIATVVVVIALAALQARRRIKAEAFEAVLFALGAVWLIAGIRFPSVTNGPATVEVVGLGALLILYAAAHWGYQRWFVQDRGA